MGVIQDCILYQLPEFVLNSVYYFATAGASKSITYLTQQAIAHGMAVLPEGNLIMADWSRRGMTIISTANGKMIKTFGGFGSGLGEFDHTEGMALTRDGHIVVADSSNHRLQVLTVKGAFVAAVGSRGTQPLQFHYPRDIAVDRNGRLFVTELWNHRVQVLNPDLSFSHFFSFCSPACCVSVPCIDAWYQGQNMVPVPPSLQYAQTTL